jgi:hypothetical protein
LEWRQNMAIGVAEPVRTEARLAERLDVAFLLLDGVRRPRLARSQEVALCALGLDRDGRPRPLALRVVAEEDEPAWTRVLRGLRTSNVGSDPLLICCDGHPALLRAIHAVFPGAPVQISIAHRLLALAVKVDGSVRAACLAEARTIFAAPDRDTAVARFRAWRAHWLRDGYRAVVSLESDLASCLTFYRFPPALWPRIRTVNLVERAFREARLAVFAAEEAADEAGAPAREVPGTPPEPAGAIPEVRSLALRPVETLPVPIASNGHAHAAGPRARDLTSDADFMWWLRETRQQSESSVRERVVAAVAVGMGLGLGAVLAFVLAHVR